MMNLQNILALSILLSISIVGCSHPKQDKLMTPRPMNDGWAVSTLEQEGFDRQKIAKVISKIPRANPKLDGIVIARHGRLVVDQYYHGYKPDSLHKIWSITKSVTGTALGIAIDKGYLTVEDSIHTYLGNYTAGKVPSIKAITIKHLITMTSGFVWDELGGPGSAGFQLPYSNDWIEFTLSQPHSRPPGTIFNYSTGNTMLLAPIIKQSTNVQAKEFATRHLFDPLKIVHFEWDTQSEFWTKTQGGELPDAKQPSDIDYKQPFADLTNTGSGLRMRPRDMCKLGQLYLDDGKWNDQQIVSKNWINASTQPHFGNEEYGYHWRLMTFEEQPCYFATGFGLQRIFVFPALELVIVLTQHYYDTMPQGNKMTNQLLKDILHNIEN